MATALSLGAVSLFLITDLDIEQNMIESFAKNTQVRQDADYVSQSLSSSVAVEVIIDTQKNGGIYDSEFLQKLAKIEQEIIAENPLRRLK